ncbi:MAG: aldehyde dehydrogenase family protein [Clostridiales bacterium]|nr:aldehyde dehydrogenase family protein [Clostridiales bacterium]
MKQEEIQLAFEQSQSVFASGATRAYGDRIHMLTALEAGIRKHEEKLIRALKSDLNKSPHEAFITELSLVYGELKHVKGQLRRWMKPKRVLPSIAQLPSSVRVLPEPYGVCLIMSPWNYPILLTLSPLIGAIAAGNTCLLKPSAYSPATSAAIAAIISDSLPKGVCNVIEGGRKENESLLDLPFDCIFFTGSPTVGRLVMEKASKHLTPVTLELGGRSPVIVDENADIEKTAKRLTFGKLTNAGQTCIAPNHVYVHKSVMDELVKALVRNFSETFQSEDHYLSDYPRIVNERHFERLMQLLEGEKIAAGGLGNLETLQIEPTIVINPSHDAPVMAEEIFGPILPILEYDDLDALVREIKKEPKPLAFYYFSKDTKRAEKIMEELSFGGGCINDCLLHITSPRAPFGGVGNSGMGSYHGYESFRTFSHFKTVLKKSLFFDVSLRYHPFTKKKAEQAQRIL